MRKFTLGFERNGVVKDLRRVGAHARDVVLRREHDDLAFLAAVALAAAKQEAARQEREEERSHCVIGASTASPRHART